MVCRSSRDVPRRVAALAAAFLRRRGFPRLLASGVALIGGVVIIGGLGYFVAIQVNGQAPHLLQQAEDVVDQLSTQLRRIPGVQGTTVQQLTDRLQTYLSHNQGTVAGEVLAVGRTATEMLTGLVIAIFSAFFFLAEGDRIWAWVGRPAPRRIRPSVNGAGYRAWLVLSGWIGGTAVIAVIHGVVIGLVLWLLGAPLVVPLALLPAAILLLVLFGENNLEGFVLQPFIVGRAVRRHPVSVVLVITGASAVAGLIGAIIAVPIVASLHAAGKYVAGVEGIDGVPLTDADRTRPITPPRTVADARAEARGDQRPVEPAVGGSSGRPRGPVGRYRSGRRKAGPCSGA